MPVYRDCYHYFYITKQFKFYNRKHVSFGHTLGEWFLVVLDLPITIHNSYENIFRFIFCSMRNSIPYWSHPIVDFIDFGPVGLEKIRKNQISKSALLVLFCDCYMRWMIDDRPIKIFVC